MPLPAEIVRISKKFTKANAKTLAAKAINSI